MRRFDGTCGMAALLLSLVGCSDPYIDPPEPPADPPRHPPADLPLDWLFGSGPEVPRADTLERPVDRPDPPHITPPPCEDPDGPPVVIWDCDAEGGYELGEFSGAGGDHEVQVVGIYDSRSPGTYLRTGTVDVRVSRLGVPITLVVSAYSATNWTITADEGAQLERVIAIGYEHQSVVAPEGVSVEIHSYDDGGYLVACGYSWPYDGQGCDTNELFAVIESLTGRAPTGFGGCYAASQATIGSGECAEPPVLAPPAPLPGLPAGEHACLALAGSTLVELSLETGARKTLAELGTAPADASSFGLVDDAVVFCDSFGPLQRASLSDGTVAYADIPCLAATGEGDGILVMPTVAADHLDYYASFEDAQDGIKTSIPVSSFASRLASADGVVYTAWHSTHLIDTYDRATGAPLGSILLEGYDTWVEGMSVTSDGVLFLNATWPEGRIAAFDVATGAALANFEPSTSGGGGTLQGLLCTHRPPDID